MRTAMIVAVFGLLSLTTVAAAQDASPSARQPVSDDGPTAAESELANRIRRLVGQLNDDRAATRDTAETDLIELAGAATARADKVLELVPAPSEQMPLALRDRLARVRRQIEDAVAKAATQGTTVTLAANNLPLSDVLAKIEEQTGNKLVDRREQFGADPSAPPLAVTLNVENEAFWPAVDQLLDAARLNVYNYGEDGLNIIPRGPDDGPRSGLAAYSGPFRIDVLEIQAQRNRRQPGRASLKLQLEIAWEPRLRPIVISQPIAKLSATDDRGNPIPVAQPEAVLDVEVPTGTQAAEIILPFEAPLRDVKQIAVLKGQLEALVPGRRVEFRFADLAKAPGKTQSRGGVHVTIDTLRKNNAIWELHMRFHLDEANDSLASHRGWVFQNLSYLEDADGKRFEQAGYETTRQTPNEVGLAYLFDLPEDRDLEGLTWVYETPAAIVKLPVEYEIKGIDLP